MTKAEKNKKIREAMAGANMGGGAFAGTSAAAQETPTWAMKGFNQSGTFADKALKPMQNMGTGEKMKYLDNMSKWGSPQTGPGTSGQGLPMGKSLDSVSAPKQVTSNFGPGPSPATTPTTGAGAGTGVAATAGIGTATGILGSLLAGLFGAYKINEAKKGAYKDIDAKTQAEDEEYKMNMRLLNRAKKMPRGERRARLINIVKRNLEEGTGTNSAPAKPAFNEADFYKTRGVESLPKSDLKSLMKGGLK